MPLKNNAEHPQHQVTKTTENKKNQLESTENKKKDESTTKKNQIDKPNNTATLISTKTASE
jgi:hypothetical protein